ncbi:MAG: hypothetical protein U5K79_23255 [Cyclobacteriaceae bacterium]|nr:hypothetical protein [Cyclobacteriaceae bacterium]
MLQAVEATVESRSHGNDDGVADGREEIGRAFCDQGSEPEGIGTGILPGDDVAVAGSRSNRSAGEVGDEPCIRVIRGSGRAGHGRYLAGQTGGVARYLVSDGESCCWKNPVVADGCGDRRRSTTGNIIGGGDVVLTWSEILLIKSGGSPCISAGYIGEVERYNRRKAKPRRRRRRSSSPFALVLQAVEATVDKEATGMTMASLMAGKKIGRAFCDQGSEPEGIGTGSLPGDDVAVAGSRSNRSAGEVGDEPCIRVIRGSGRAGHGCDQAGQTGGVARYLVSDGESCCWKNPVVADGCGDRRRSTTGDIISSGGVVRSGSRACWRLELALRPT